MVYKFDGYNWLVRLEKGELLMENLLKLAKTENIKGGWISGIGASAWVEMGCYNPTTKDYYWKKFDQNFEITSLQGNVSWVDNKPFMHIHGTFADENMHGLGGHIKELEISATCEIFLHNWFGGQLARSYDEQTRLKLLDL